VAVSVFPTELAFFLMGVSYRLYRHKRAFFSSWFGLYATIFVIVATGLYQFMPGIEVQGANIKKWVYYLMLVFFIPWVFSYTSRFRVDRYLGDLSYPVYIVHYFVLWLWVLLRDELLDTLIYAVAPRHASAYTRASIALFHLS
jgi:peptidoglycan/LPS O-acetylase OafA/YrhL